MECILYNHELYRLLQMLYVALQSIAGYYRVSEGATETTEKGLVNRATAAT